MQQEKNKWTPFPNQFIQRLLQMHYELMEKVQVDRPYLLEVVRFHFRILPILDVVAVVRVLNSVVKGIRPRSFYRVIERIC